MVLCKQNPIYVGSALFRGIEYNGLCTYKKFRVVSPRTTTSLNFVHKSAFTRSGRAAYHVDGLRRRPHLKTCTSYTQALKNSTFNLKISQDSLHMQLRFLFRSILRLWSFYKVVQTQRSKLTDIRQNICARGSPKPPGLTVVEHNSPHGPFEHITGRHVYGCQDLWDTITQDLKSHEILAFRGIPYTLSLSDPGFLPCWCAF